MQYTNNILDILVTIGHNIQSMVAYRSTGMELRLLFYSLTSIALLDSCDLFLYFYFKTVFITAERIFISITGFNNL